MRIVILEDNLDRQAAMSVVLNDLFPAAVIEYFAVAKQMIQWLDVTGIYDVALISLDNDLEMLEGEDGLLVDAGDGVDVAKWLVTMPPVVPVVIHTTNTTAGDRIEELLRSHGWLHARVVPYAAEVWVQETWRSTVRRLIVAHAPDATVSSVGVTVLKHGLQYGWSLEVILRDILEVGVIHSHGDKEPRTYNFELACLSHSGNLDSIVSIGNSVLSEIGYGATREFMELSADCFGIGPVTLDSTDRLIRNLLVEKGFKEIQLDVLQPTPSHQAVFLSGNTGTHLNLGSPRVQANIRAMKELLELALVIALREPQNAKDHALEPELLPKERSAIHG